MQIKKKDAVVIMCVPEFHASTKMEVVSGSFCWQENISCTIVDRKCIVTIIIKE
jgi:hypothetical protein